ncbi:MAG: MBL fold metallo-hydrolase [Parcubacteria group bacterium]|nr:MBL fold metallo-hydrolase [Parcubacteria group bacterium]
MSKAKLTFCGGAGEVTGSNFLLETDEASVLVDCGLFEGCDTCGDKNVDPFPYDPKKIDALFVTHPHVDHVGRIPKLVKEGFRGTIYSTPPTRDIVEVVYDDALKIMREETARTGAPLLYGPEDVTQTLALWETREYRKTFVVKGLTASFKNSGHVLGSAMVELERGGKKIVFTGDLGNFPSPLLPDPDAVNDADYLVMESVYGDRNHEARDERRSALEDIIEETSRKKGVLMIPAFSLERTQAVLYEIEHMVEGRQIPRMPVFIDSPLAIKITDIYKKYSSTYFNKSVGMESKGGNGIFAFAELSFTRTSEESKHILAVPEPKIIIAGGGMSEGGRIIFHEKHYLPQPKNTLLILGYQAPGTRGREIEDGAKTIEILGEEIPVNARIRTISGYSAHMDSEHLLEFAANDADAAKTIFVVMGEPKSAFFLTQRIRDYVGLNAVAPQRGDTFPLDF